MSRLLISRSEDLTKLQDEGYELDIVANHLVISHVPYLTVDGVVKHGTLMCPLVLENDKTAQPTDHTMMFDGEKPYGQDGVELKIVAGTGHQQITHDLSHEFVFSRKPMWEGNRYRDFHHKVTTYVDFVSKHALAVDPQATARTYRHLPVSEEDGSIFIYRDTASARAGIQPLADKLEQAGPVAIVGLGGTGSYILDLVAKSPVKEIHLYDGDRFSQHNAFRAPGAPAGGTLDGAPLKVEYLGGIYGRMHGGIKQHPCFLSEENTEELRSMKFVFVSVDDADARKLITERLAEYGVPFVDVGMGLYEQDGVLGGIVRVTTSTESNRERAAKHMPLSGGNAENEYRSNIQIADLNALNAALAVIKWKKMFNFYQDTDSENHSDYVVGGNTMINGD
ncbi:MAG TPA: ThiF family adenylyltransferase [Candidatus Saccharimonadales bacterium]|nr:ThiF family adenylyltransferase [Candidatus Saccharimonadales bacterium]